MTLRDEPDARLIAAAPDLLAACEAALPVVEASAALHAECGPRCTVVTARDRLRAALNAARGQERDQ